MAIDFQKLRQISQTIQPSSGNFHELLNFQLTTSLDKDIEAFDKRFQQSFITPELCKDFENFVSEADVIADFNQFIPNCNYYF